MKKRILVVVDAAFMRMTLRKMLEEAGYDVMEAPNGNEAVRLWEELAPDLATMDITMPEMDGISAVRAIRALDPKAKIVMCSAMGQQSMVVEAITAGAKDFIVKPFQKERVLKTVGNVLE
ncbi:response regulator [Heliobacterium gestii]|uniref:Stage 0 sporulation protein A homolog n=1 Tax=Heliomicrobium gestii TaxID=2699 RepID=A0A845L991_HELGE|nr:response regulator [Heliomicrobium gestii]MBM7865563.1 two-component system chemotaxis response regulator CheY [Heliomicrobium gestii]MZP41814.1 response regulator [Heliomicrobium gestii]